MIRRLIAVVLVLALSSGCGATNRVLLDTGQGAPREFPQATSHDSTPLDARAFEDALTHLVLVDATRELKRATDRATTPQELESAAERFARRVGPRVGRVLVLAVSSRQGVSQRLPEVAPRPG